MIPYHLENGNILYSTQVQSSEWIETITNPRTVKGLWAYAPMLPVSPEYVISMGEGATPLVAAPRLSEAYGAAKLWIKNEGLNPTGTFKDRCHSIAISRAVESGAKGVILGSAGNASAAAAAYAARAGLACIVFLPAHTAETRMAQTLQYGAHVIKIKGSVNDCVDMITCVREKYPLENVTTAICMNPWQGEGCKTIAYEIAWQLGFEAPDWIICPIGGGGILYGIYTGFRDMFELGLIKSLPRMAGIQAAGCAAISKAFRENRRPDQIETFPAFETLAVAIADPYPLDGKEALGAIYATKGYADSVTDEEIMLAQKDLSSQEGIFAEPASSVTVAALRKLLAQNVISQSESVVCIVTGNGLKDLPSASMLMPKPPVLEPDRSLVLGEIEKFFAGH